MSCLRKRGKGEEIQTIARLRVGDHEKRLLFWKRDEERTCEAYGSEIEI